MSSFKQMFPDVWCSRFPGTITICLTNQILRYTVDASTCISLYVIICLFSLTDGPSVSLWSTGNFIPLYSTYIGQHILWAGCPFTGNRAVSVSRARLGSCYLNNDVISNDYRLSSSSIISRVPIQWHIVCNCLADTESGILWPVCAVTISGDWFSDWATRLGMWSLIHTGRLGLCSAQIRKFTIAYTFPDTMRGVGQRRCLFDWWIIPLFLETITARVRGNGQLTPVLSRWWINSFYIISFEMQLFLLG